MKGIRIGKWQQVGGIRLKSLAINVVLMILAIGNAVAAMFEWYDSVGMLVFNGVCVALLVLAVMHKVLTMEPRKMWRTLSFLLSAIGVLSVFCAQFLEGEIASWLKILLMVFGGILLLVGGVSMVRWRRYSIERKEQLQNSRSKKIK